MATPSSLWDRVLLERTAGRIMGRFVMVMAALVSGSLPPMIHCPPYLPCIFFKTALDGFSLLTPPRLPTSWCPYSQVLCFLLFPSSFPLLLPLKLFIFLPSLIRFSLLSQESLRMTLGNKEQGKFYVWSAGLLSFQNLLPSLPPGF